MIKKLSIATAAIAFTLVLTLTMLGQAEAGRGTLQGSVLDPSGALIPHALVTVSNPNGFSRTLTSDATGNFALAHLAPGTYSVSINAPGFTPALDGGIHVASAKVTREDVTLGISVNQQIEVSANDDPNGNNDSTDTAR